MPVTTEELTPESRIQPVWQVPARYTLLAGPAVSRTVPFTIFMAFIAVEELARVAAGAGWLSLSQGALYYLYPFKAASAGLLLWLYRKENTEFALADLVRDRRWIAVSLAGVLTFLLWISMDWTLPAAAAPAGFDPALLPAGPVRLVMLSFRVAGAVLVVPLLEELFWRSFLLRYLVASNFTSIPLGTFTWGSCIIAALLFGLEHHYFYAGVMAGLVYSIILYKTRSLAHCVLAHAVTNLSLAIYVLYTGKWYFW